MKRKVLFLCTGNSARSQMAEAILNMNGKDKFIAFSAGTNPANEINHLAVKAMARLGIDISNKKPKSVKEFSNEEFDFVITLCDKGKEQCINYVGMPIFSHWGLPDPAEFNGTEQEKSRQFDEMLQHLVTRINLFSNIRMDKLDKLALETKTKEIAQCPLEVKNGSQETL